MNVFKNFLILLSIFCTATAFAADDDCSTRLGGKSGDGLISSPHTDLILEISKANLVYPQMNTGIAIHILAFALATPARTSLSEVISPIGDKDIQTVAVYMDRAHKAQGVAYQTGQNGSQVEDRHKVSSERLKGLLTSQTVGALINLIVTVNLLDPEFRRAPDYPQYFRHYARMEDEFEDGNAITRTVERYLSKKPELSDKLKHFGDSLDRALSSPAVKDGFAKYRAAVAVLRPMNFEKLGEAQNSVKVDLRKSLFDQVTSDFPELDRKQIEDWLLTVSLN